MGNTLAIVIVGLLSAASLVVWIKIGLRIRQGEPILEASPESTLPIVHWMPLLLTLLLVSQGIIGLLETRTAATTIKIDRIQIRVMLSCVMLVLLLMPLLQNGAKSFGFSAANWQRQVGQGCVGFIVCVLPVVLCLLLTLGLREPTNEHPYLQALQEGSFEIVFWICMSAVVMAPILEELIYRVVLQTWLQHLLTPNQALVLTAAIFAAVHRLPDAIPLFPLALILGYLYQRKRSFLAIVTLHAVFNGVNIILDLLSTE